MRRSELRVADRQSGNPSVGIDPRAFSEVEKRLDAFSGYWKARLAALEEVLNEEAGR
jgi:hypothetical protein